MQNYAALLAKSLAYTGLVVLFFVIQGCSNKEFTPVGGGILASPSGGGAGDPNNPNGDGSGNIPANGGDGSGNIPANGGTGGTGAGGTGGTGAGGTGGTGTGGAGGTGGTGTGGTTPGGANDPLPKMTTEAPLCGAFRDCPAYFILTAPAAKTLTFNWRTNDTLYTSNPARIAQPNVHYVPTSGSVSFAVGEQRRPISVRSLNITSMLTIPYIFSNCVWGGVPISCALLVQ